jgi:TPP-dependent 2-oxoacid decarboxylase
LFDDGAEDNAIILVDACVVRHEVLAEVEALVRKTGYPVFAAPMGKTAVSEEYERYGGVSNPNVRIDWNTHLRRRSTSAPSVNRMSKPKLNPPNSFS